MELGSRIECHASKNNLFDHWEQRSMTLTSSSMVSFDVVSLLTSTPIILALQVTKSRLEADPTISERINMCVNNIMNLLEFVLDNNYFIVDDQSYVPIFANDANHCVGIRSVVNIGPASALRL